MTSEKYKRFSNSSVELSDIDYLYYCDADIIFEDNFDNAILSQLVATQHCGFYNQRGVPETNSESLACVQPNEEMQYFVGGKYGRKSLRFLKMPDLR